jgi:hypothetical protein
MDDCCSEATRKYGPALLPLLPPAHMLRYALVGARLIGDNSCTVLCRIISRVLSSSRFETLDLQGCGDVEGSSDFGMLLD